MPLNDRQLSAFAFAAGVAAAVPAALWLWGFMVDDALIIARYAHHLARGEGYRFNAGGPVTDGVTPLGFALLLAPMAGGGVLSAFRVAKVLGFCAWLLGAGCLGLAIHRLEGARRKWLALLLVAVSAPLAAWSVAGMETGLVMALGSGVASARALGREKAAMACAALLAAWRPEAALFAMVVALAPPRAPEPKRRWLRLVAVLAPVLVVVLLRSMIFGHAAPLGAIAKQSDLKHGAYYALACLLLCGPLAALAYKSLPTWVRGLAAAVAAHFVAMAIAGGDWMPLSRLAVPALPAAVLVAACALGNAHPLVGYPRLLIGLAGPGYVFATVGPRAATVGEKRMAVIDELRPALRDARVVAALDIGWVGAASDATIVDLAGVTDPAVAVLPGGHTSKPVPHALLVKRGVDTLVLRLADQGELREPWTHSDFATRVEFNVAFMPRMTEDFVLVATSAGSLRYLVLRRRP